MQHLHPGFRGARPRLSQDRCLADPRGTLDHEQFRTPATAAGKHSIRRGKDRTAFE
jgi:hypothetical protein